MTSSDFTATFTVDRTPEEVFAAINDVRAWWSGNIEGDTDALGAEFTYRYQDVHYTKQKISEFLPNQRVVWHIEEAFLNFTEEPDEWVGTDVTFEITPKGDETEVRFTHRGLVPKQRPDHFANGFGSRLLERLGLLRQRESETSDHDRSRRTEPGRERGRVNRRLLQRGLSAKHPERSSESPQ